MAPAAVTFQKNGVKKIDGSMGVLGLLSSRGWSNLNCAIIRLESTESDDELGPRQCRFDRCVDPSYLHLPDR